MSVFQNTHIPGQLLASALENEEVLAEEEYKLYRSELAKNKNSLEKNNTLFQEGQISEQEYVERLQKYLHVPDSYIIRKAFSQLKAFGEKNAIDELILSLNSHLYRKSFDAVVYSLAGAFNRDDLESTRIISERKEISRDLEEWWSRNRDKSKAMWFADLLLNGKTNKAKEVAINKLRLEFKSPEVTPYLIRYIKSQSDDYLLISVLNLLGEIGDASAVPIIKEKLYHCDIYMRKEASVALHKLGDDSGIPIMIESFNSNFVNNQSVANSALMEITGEDFTEGMSLRHLDLDKRNKAIERWRNWWKQNKTSIKADEVVNFSKVLDGESGEIANRFAAIKNREKLNPELPVFDDPNKTPRVTFGRFKRTVLSADDETALLCMTENLRQNYKIVLENLGDKRSDFINSMIDISFDSRLGNTLYYELFTEQDDGLFCFPIHFVQDFDGNWLISLL